MRSDDLTITEGNWKVPKNTKLSGSEPVILEELSPKVSPEMKKPLITLRKSGCEFLEQDSDGCPKTPVRRGVVEMCPYYLTIC